MAHYEIREDTSNKYWPFIVVDLEDGKPIRDRFTKREDAQHWIDTIDEVSEPNLYLFNAFFGDDLEGTDTIIQPGSEEEATYNRQKAEWEANHPVQPTPATTPEPAPEEEAEFVGGQHQVGAEMTDKDGNVYVAIQPSYYISERDAADLEDGWDAQVSAGWHTPVRLKSQSTEVIVEQVQAGQAEIVRRDGATHVLFHDENQSIPLSDLAYSSDLGLYQKSKFPHEQ